MAHIHEKIDFTVAVMIVHANKVLLRWHDKYKFWYVPGGHVELNEDPIQTVLREAKEETGLAIRIWDKNKKLEMNEERGNELIPPISMNRHFTTPDHSHEHINMLYFAYADTETLSPAPGEQQDGMQWCTKEELETMDLQKDVAFFSKLALETLGE